MCYCSKPTINGQPGYRWNDEKESIHPVNPPELQTGDVLLYDEPGRCGGIDSHSHHYRVVKHYGTLRLYVRHGGGDVGISLSLYKQQADILIMLDSNGRYWMLNAIYHAYADGLREAREAEASKWRTAAAEKRIRVRKLRGGEVVSVRIDPRVS